MQPLILCQVQNVLLINEYLFSMPSGHLQIGNFTTILPWVFIWHETLQPRIVVSWPFSGWGELASNIFGSFQVFQVLGNHLPLNPPLREVSPILEFSHGFFSHRCEIISKRPQFSKPRKKKIMRQSSAKFKGKKFISLLAHLDDASEHFY